jgi:hypothetical protein
MYGIHATSQQIYSITKIRISGMPEPLNPETRFNGQSANPIGYLWLHLPLREWQCRVMRDDTMVAQFCAAINCSNTKLMRPEFSVFRFSRDVERHGYWIITIFKLLCIPSVSTNGGLHGTLHSSTFCNVTPSTCRTSRSIARLPEVILRMLWAIENWAICRVLKVLTWMYVTMYCYTSIPTRMVSWWTLLFQLWFFSYSFSYSYGFSVKLQLFFVM